MTSPEKQELAPAVDRSRLRRKFWFVSWRANAEVLLVKLKGAFDGAATARLAGLLAGPVLFVFILFGTELAPGQPAVTITAAVAVLMAVWWITEAIPLAATALIPIAFFPLMGVADGESIARSYMNTTILLFLGGFLLALAMERWNLHRRIALRIILLFGGRPASLVLGFMVAAALLSMWISNTATAVMMLPMALAIVRRVEKEHGSWEGTKPLLLGIAYACSIGGVATLIGTPPNLILRRTLSTIFPEAPVPGFGQWFVFGFPFSVLLLFGAWFLLTRVLFNLGHASALENDELRREYRALGPASAEERTVLTLFGLTALLWIFRSPIEVGALRIAGWASLLPAGEMIDDGVVAMIASVALFVLPARKDQNGRRGSLLEADVFAQVPWGIILLFGGGFALAKAFGDSGLARALVDRFAELPLPGWALVATITTGMNFLTELTSNTASTQMVLPVLAAIAVGENLHPMLLMLPASLAASMAFMMPVATPPNAIVFSSNRLRIIEMVKAGFWLNLFSIALICLFTWLLAVPVFDLGDGSLPAWAQTVTEPE